MSVNTNASIKPTVPMPKDSNLPHDATNDNSLVDQLVAMAKEKAGESPSYSRDDVFGTLGKHSNPFVKDAIPTVKKAFTALDSIARQLANCEMTHDQMVTAIMEKESAKSPYRAAVDEIAALEKELEDKKAALKKSYAPEKTPEEKNALRNNHTIIVTEHVTSYTNALIHLIAPKEKDSTVATMARWINENIPVLSDAVTAPGQKGDNVSAEIRKWVEKLAKEKVSIAGFTFGTDEKGRAFMIDKMEEVHTLNSGRGRMAKAFSTAYRQITATTAKA